MLVSTIDLLQAAVDGSYAIGAFNVYNLEGALAVTAAAEEENSPAMLQILPTALVHGGAPLVALCQAAARESSVPLSVHLDHSKSARDIEAALNAGLSSVMADGSHLSYDENVAFTTQMVSLVHQRKGIVEAELGRLTGTEDGLTIPEYESRLTNPDQAVDFTARTGIDALAVCIGNVHGKYRGEPHLDFDRLNRIREAVPIPLVLHGASGLPESLVRQSIELGICKFNVNTEVRSAFVQALRETMSMDKAPDLLDLMQNGVAAMQPVVAEKLRLFGSTGKA